MSFDRDRVGDLLWLGKKVGVELGADQYAQGRNIEPDQGGHHRAQRAVNDRIIGEAGEIKTEAQGSQEPDPLSQYRCGTSHDPLILQT